MASFRDQIKAYVDGHWMVPCQDGLVWVYYAAIDTNAEIAKHKKGGVAVFLQYADATYGSLEGLYLVPAADLPRVKSGKFDASLYPNRKMISSWYDNSSKNTFNPEVQTQNPPYNGLNDCAHFVTQSLAAGGIHVETTGVPTLFNKLYARGDTKTLAKTVDAATAEVIINSGIMKVGDVVMYAKGKELHHSVVYMGSGKIAMHTWANHPDHPTLHGDWKASATEDHPLVTLIHFSRDDIPIDPNSGMLGWWQVVWRGNTYYYFFEKSGNVAYTKHKPANLTHPLVAADGRGYSFRLPHHAGMCWTETGTFETLNVHHHRVAAHLEGKGSGNDPLVADKM